MKVLGERISILKKENLLSVVILPGLDKKRLVAIFLWLFAWTTCGIIVFANYFQTDNRDIKLFIIVYLSFWFYFEYNIIRSFIWKRSGKEKIWIQDGILHYQREINKRGKIQEYNLGLLSKVEVLELRPTRFSDTVMQSFWIKGGERLEFVCQGKHVRFGMQINDNEAYEIRREINHFIS